jgi:hypothetical protein
VAALGETVFAEPSEMVRMASAATVPPQASDTARAARRPKTPVVECARPVRTTVQAIGTLGPSNQASQAGYAAPIPAWTPASPGTANVPREIKTPREPVVQPIGVSMPAGE